jgi:hypothetical protein
MNWRTLTGVFMMAWRLVGFCWWWAMFLGGRWMTDDNFLSCWIFLFIMTFIFR